MERSAAAFAGIQPNYLSCPSFRRNFYTYVPSPSPFADGSLSSPSSLKVNSPFPFPPSFAGFIFSCACFTFWVPNFIEKMLLNFGSLWENGFVCSSKSSFPWLLIQLFKHVLPLCVMPFYLILTGLCGIIILLLSFKTESRRLLLWKQSYRGEIICFVKFGHSFFEWRYSFWVLAFLNIIQKN